MLHKENNGIWHLFKTIQINFKLYIYINLNIQWRKIVSNEWFWKNWTAIWKNKIDLSFTQYRKTNSKWIKDLDVRPKNMKLLQESTGDLFFVLWSAIGSWFLDRSPHCAHVISLLNKAIFPFLPTLISPVLAFEWLAAEPVG